MICPDKALSVFLHDLAQFRLPNTANPYNTPSEPQASRQRRDHLMQYLSHFLDYGCPALLVAEAFGYRGGRVTGIPLTSERIIQHDPFFRQCFPEIADKYVPCGEPGARQSELSATVVWRTFAELALVPPPCCWNILPLHPYDAASGPWSNRGPTQPEVTAGAEFTLRLIELLRPGQVIAVGRHSARRLEALEIAHHAVRHPSQGGAALFRAQMLGLFRP